MAECRKWTKKYRNMCGVGGILLEVEKALQRPSSYCFTLWKAPKSRDGNMDNSSVSSVMGDGWANFQDGNKIGLFSLYGSTPEVWKTRNLFELGGKSSVTIDLALLTATIEKGPSKHSINFATCSPSELLNSCLLCKVDRWTRSPVLKGKVSVHDLLDCAACKILALARLSWASSICMWILFMISCVEASPMFPGLMFGMRGGSIQGERPILSWNRQKPVDLLTVSMMLNQIIGRAWIQPFWLRLTW